MGVAEQEVLQRLVKSLLDKILDDDHGIPDSAMVDIADICFILDIPVPNIKYQDGRVYLPEKR